MTTHTFFEAGVEVQSCSFVLRSTAPLIPAKALHDQWCSFSLSMYVTTALQGCVDLLMQSTVRLPVAAAPRVISLHYGVGDHSLEASGQRELYLACLHEATWAMTRDASSHTLPGRRILATGCPTL